MTANRPNSTDHDLQRRHRRVAFSAFSVVCLMVGLSFAAVPLYQIFCQVTGYGGTTRRADANTGPVLDRMITVRFDSTTAPDLDWRFRPVQQTVDLKIGENKLAFYQATNEADTAVTGTATFNVTPEIAGSYFNKIECFCFTEQKLQPGQTVDMPVSFFIDPEIVNDPDTKSIEEITLSYTFFAVKKTAQAGRAKADGGS